MRRLPHAWYVPCIPVLASGCYFWLPFVPEAQNVGPTIDRSSPAEGEPLRMTSETVVVFITVIDPNDPEKLEYFWYIDNLGQQGVAMPVTGNSIYGSQLTLQRNELYDGRTLQVLVSDSFGERDDRSWLIEVPPEGP